MRVLVHVELAQQGVELVTCGVGFAAVELAAALAAAEETARGILRDLIPEVEWYVG